MPGQAEPTFQLGGRGAARPKDPGEAAHRVGEPATGRVVVHPVRPAPRGVSLRQQAKSLFDALLYKKHPALYRRRVRPGPPWDYDATVAATAAAALGVWVGSPRTARDLHTLTHGPPRR